MKPLAGRPLLVGDPALRTAQALRRQERAGLTCARLASLVCTHGADSVTEMAVLPRNAGGDPRPRPTGATSGAGAGESPAGAPAAAGTARSEAGTANAGAPDKVGCYGDGSNGLRVRAIYARPDGSPDRYPSMGASFRNWAGSADRVFDASAQQTGSHRHIRFATSSGTSCALSVLRVTLPAAAFDSLGDTVRALQDVGLDHSDSKYLVWADSAVYCGIATTFADDSPGLGNLNNGSGPSYARIDRQCWGRAEAHEIVHMLGGVQVSAPHATAGYHCNDGAEVMCYDDGTANAAQHDACANSNAALLDCNHDDYYSTAAPRGSYLQTHWNVARSSFLVAEPGDSAASRRAGGRAPSSPKPSPKPSPAPTASTGPAPSPTPTPSPSPSPTELGLVLPSLPPLSPLSRAGAQR